MELIPKRIFHIIYYNFLQLILFCYFGTNRD
jgi:hypothetical protein